MKAVADAELVRALAEAQGGVFSTGDLRTAFADPHPAGFRRRVVRLAQVGVLTRFCRGFYVTGSFELAVLSQRLAPDSCISFESVLARELVIGTNPARRVVAMRAGRPRTYAALDYRVEHVHLADHLMFGTETREGVRYSDREKAVLDVLFYHLRGRRFAFDPFSDLHLDRLDRKRLREYLTRYRNPKFRAFAERTLQLT